MPGLRSCVCHVGDGNRGRVSMKECSKAFVDGAFPRKTCSQF